MHTPHYLRFVQALVLAAAVPACSGVDDTSKTSTAETREPSSDAPVETTSPAPISTATPPTEPVDAGAEPVDASLPRVSGPMVPPELAA